MASAVDDTPESVMKTRLDTFPEYDDEFAADVHYAYLSAEQMARSARKIFLLRTLLRRRYPSVAVRERSNFGTDVPRRIWNVYRDGAGVTRRNRANAGR